MDTLANRNPGIRRRLGASVTFPLEVMRPQQAVAVTDTSTPRKGRNVNSKTYRQQQPTTGGKAEGKNQQHTKDANWRGGRREMINIADEPQQRYQAECKNKKSTNS